MIPKSGTRFLEKIMLKQELELQSDSIELERDLALLLSRL